MSFEYFHMIYQISVHPAMFQVKSYHCHSFISNFLIGLLYLLLYIFKPDFRSIIFTGALYGLAQISLNQTEQGCGSVFFFF